MDFIFDPSLVLYLPLYQLDGSSFASKDAYGHLCTATGALWRPRGRKFDGDDHISIPDHNMFSFTDGEGTDKPFSLWAWVKIDAVGAYQAVLAKRSAFDVAEWIFQIQDTGVLWCRLYSASDAANRLDATCDSAIDAIAYYLIGLVYDGLGATTSFTFYINGEAKTDTCVETGAYAGMSNTPAPIQIGAMDGATKTNPLTGVIGEVGAYYDKMFSPLEMMNIYLATKWRYR